MGTRTRTFVAAFPLIALLLASCGGGSGQTQGANSGPVSGSPGSPAPPAPAPPPVVGYFKDANVAGLSYRSGGIAGVTDTAGQFTCEADRSVSFAIGAVDLGGAVCDRLLSPLDLVPRSTIDTPGVLNRVRFLLLLDADGDPTNGIAITPEVHALANDWAPLEFSTLNFTAEVSNIVDSLRSIGAHARLPDDRDARAHLLDTVACTHAGGYWLWLNTGPNTAIVNVLALYPREHDGVALVGGGWSDQPDDYLAYSAPSSAIEYADATGIEFSAPSGPTFTARFARSDELVGEWSRGARTFRGERARGTTPGAATHRFVAYLEDDSCCTAVYTIDLFADNRVVATESWLSAWEFPEDILYTGVVEGNRLTLSDSTYDAELAGTIDLTADPPTIQLEANNWMPSGTVTASGCRLE